MHERKVTHGFTSLQQDAKEFFSDVHVVTRNFMGQQDWEWAKDNDQNQDKPSAKKTRWERFTEEMTQGTQSINNDSKIEERINLGIATALFSIPYALGRMVTDGALNTFQYAEWRITRKPLAELHPKDRKVNGYVLGAPLSALLITPMAAIELALRAVGISAYSIPVIRAAAKRAANMSIYTRKLFGTYEASLAEDQNKVFSRPKSGWDVADRFGLITIPGLIAALEIGVAASFTALCGTGEYLGRALGLTRFGGGVIRLAWRRAANMSKFTRALFGIHFPDLYNLNLKEEQDKLFKKPEEGWNSRNLTNRIGIVTIPGIIAAIGIGFGTVITAVGYTTEYLGRALGFTRFGGGVIRLAWLRATNMSKYTRALFGIRDAHHYSLYLKGEQDKLFKKPVEGWNSANLTNRIGIATIPGIIAAIGIGFGAAVTAIGYTGQFVRRALGFTSYGANIIVAAHKRAINISNRYTGWLRDRYSKNSIAMNEEVLKSKPNNAWDVVDRAAFVTIPGVIAAIQISMATAMTLVCGTIEVIGRALGFTSYGKRVIDAAAVRMAQMSTYTRNLFPKLSRRSAKFDQAIVFSKPMNGWQAINRIGLVTIPGVIAAMAIGFGAAVTAIGYTGKFLYRALGFTPYGGHVIVAAAKRAANISQRYMGWLTKHYDQESIDINQKIVFSKPNNAWEAVDRLALFTISGVIALAEIAVTSVVTIGLGTIETIGRVLGISERALCGMAIVVSKCANLLGFSDSDDKKAIKTVMAPVRSWWDAADCIGVAIGGTMAAILATAQMLPLAIIGISKSNYHRFNYYRNRINNAIRGREGKSVDRTNEDYHAAKLKECEQTPLGNFFSKFNILNIVGQGLYYTGRYVAMPVCYAAFRCITQMFGIIPLVKAINRAIHPPIYNSNLPEDRVRQRFEDLTKALDVNGRLPVTKALDTDDEPLPILNDLTSPEVDNAIKAANGRNTLSRIGFGLFSEARRIKSLGQTREERILSVFKDKFEEFMRVKKRQEKEGVNINVNQFFTNDVQINNGQRFSFEHMVDNIKRSFSPDDWKKVDKVAELFKKDIELDIQGSRPAKKLN